MQYKCSLSCRTIYRYGTCVDPKACILYTVHLKTYLKFALENKLWHLKNYKRKLFSALFVKNRYCTVLYCLWLTLRRSPQHCFELPFLQNYFLLKPYTLFYSSENQILYICYSISMLCDEFLAPEVLNVSIVPPINSYNTCTLHIAQCTGRKVCWTNHRFHSGKLLGKHLNFSNGGSPHFK